MRRARKEAQQPWWLGQGGTLLSAVLVLLLLTESLLEVSETLSFYLCFLKIQVLANGSEQATQALQGFFIVVLQQLHHAVMHDGFRQHFEFEELSDELDITNGSPPGFVLSFFQFIVEPRPLLWLLCKEYQNLDDENCTVDTKNTHLDSWSLPPFWVLGITFENLTATIHKILHPFQISGTEWRLRVVLNPWLRRLSCSNKKH